MSRADQNRSPLTEAASISSDAGLESFGLTAASASVQRVDLGLQALGMATRRAAELILGRGRQMWVVCSAKLAAFCRSRVSSTSCGAEQVEAVAIAVRLGQGEHDAARGQREDQDPGEVADPYGTDEQNIIRHAHTPALERNFTGLITPHLH